MKEADIKQYGEKMAAFLFSCSFLLFIYSPLNLFSLYCSVIILFSLIHILFFCLCYHLKEVDEDSKSDRQKEAGQ